MNTHNRVIPRDFFNEAKLLKCMGLLSLKILDNMIPDGLKIEISESGEPFDIRLLNDGSLTVINYPVIINDKLSVTLKTTYNSKVKYPLLCEYNYIEYEVFDDNGNFTQEFIEAFKI